MAERVEILLSTYNGEKWLPELIQSIFDQDYENISLLIRDDGSTDGTTTYLQEISKIYNNCKIIYGVNIGIHKSFMYLLEHADPESHFFAFADQDDVWKKDKISRAIDKINKTLTNKPILYHSRLEFVNEQLQHLGYSLLSKKVGFEMALVQNQATGCTIIFNKLAKDLICQSIPSWSLMHDWWCYLVVTSFGEIIYDSYPSIYYRKHDKNTTPASPNLFKELYARMHLFFGRSKNYPRISNQAKEFLDRYGNMLDDYKKNVILNFLKAKESRFIYRILYCLKMPLYRNTLSETIVLRLLIILGSF